MKYTIVKEIDSGITMCLGVYTNLYLAQIILQGIIQKYNIPEEYIWIERKE